MEEKKYNPQTIEPSIYNLWKKLNCFQPDMINHHKESYCIMMPPPNITGELHLGHAFQQTIMDILIRFHRMHGKRTLWMTGFDHAGIATQILIENYIYKKTGKTRKDYTKDFLLKQIYKWKKKSECLMSYQMQRLGNSIDWTRKRFTMDTDMSFAVKEAFIRLYNDNLIYKGKKLINWDYKLQTAISDLEVSYKSVPGFIWYLKYQFSKKNNFKKTNNKNYIVVATTRPETIFGDIAIAIHPEDYRYNQLIGEYVIVPLINRKIPIISDSRIDIKKGTGCVKITPAHDFNDYIIGKQHKLIMINIFSLNRKILHTPEVFNHEGKIQNQVNYHIPKIFHDIDCDQARKLVVSECDKMNLLEDTHQYNLNVPYNSRTETIIEPMLTDQWYIKSKYLSEQAIYIVKKDNIEFIPKKYKNMYFKWMENIQDWCISRQIWWGHEIPAWYDDNNKIYVGHSEEEIRLHNQLNKDIILHKDNDVLDTWFSSSLWTFSSLGWPTNTDLFKTFHPTNVIVSGFDIIFFWIAKMIMMTMYLIKDHNNKPQIPFKKVYITGLLRDELGQKMSKSKGNILDPLDMIDGISIETLLKKRIASITQSQSSKKIINYTKKKFPNGIQAYGADAVRLTLTAISSSGHDIYWDMHRLSGYYNFCNKLWNVSKFVLMHTINKDCGIVEKEKIFSLPDQWITTKLHQTIQNFCVSLEHYRFDIIVNTLYEFVWHQFCDWYIEFSKPIIQYENNILKLRGTRYTLIISLEIILRLAHPIIPFITEKIWQKVKTILNISGKTIMLEPFPSYDRNMINLNTINDIEWIKNIISEIRNLRKYIDISNKILLESAFICHSQKIKKLILENKLILMNIAQLKNIKYSEYQTIHLRSILISIDELNLFIYLPDNFNKESSMRKFYKEINSLNHKINIIQKKLINVSNSSFIKEQEKLMFYKNMKNKLLSQYNSIKIL